MYIRAILLSSLLYHSINCSHAMQFPVIEDASGEINQQDIGKTEKPGFSTSVLNAYAHDQKWEEQDIKAVSLLARTDIPIEELVEPWESLWFKTYMHKNQGQAKFLKVCREILVTENQQEPLVAYHGYGVDQALLYDIYTTIASVLDNKPAQPRSRFRFHINQSIPAYRVALDLPRHLTSRYRGLYWNDHDDQFKMHGISSGPHVFSNSHEMGESPLQALLGIFNHSSSDTLSNLIKETGIKATQKYLDLIPLYLKENQEDGGFITRFNFKDTKVIDAASYPSPLSKAGRYGLPCQIQTENGLEFAYFSEILPLLKMQKLYSMQLRQVYIPDIYTDEEAVKTQTFSLADLPKTEEYYNLLVSYIREDLKDRSHLENQQVQYWLQSR